MGRIHPLVPTTGAMSVQGKLERGHMCARCMNPFTRSGNPACPNAGRASQVVPYMGELEGDSGEAEL